MGLSYLISTGVMLLLVVLLAGRASSADDEVLEENTLGGCGVSHGALHNTAKGWQYTPCHSEKNGACFVPEHEKRYQALVKACEAEQSNRSALIRQYRADFPSYSSDVIVSLSQLNVTLRTHHDRLESMVQDHHYALLNTTEYAVQLVRDIVLTSLEANRTDQALRHYAALLEPELKQLVQESYGAQRTVRIGTAGRKVALLLQFVRALPDANERAAVYRQLEELLQIDGQDERYPGVLFTDDAAKYGAGTEPVYKPNPERYPKRALERWQRQLDGGFFAELSQFAGDHPDYYERIERELLHPVAERWSVKTWPRMVAYPNALPRLEQRVRAFRLLLDTAQKQQQQQLNDQQLMLLAGEMLKVERELTVQGGEQQQQQQLTELREMFPQRSYDRSYRTYAELFALYKP
uniref:Putative secreted protein n=2 Tax=Anopheles marajoara TaxID=58244 RepID=A0A2M4BPR2_9DIPT